MTRRPANRAGRRAAALIAILAIAALWYFDGGLGPLVPEDTPVGGVATERGDEQRADASVDADGGAGAVRDLFETRSSGVMVSVRGVVDRLLPDDDEGSRHQRFVLRLESGHTLLVAHNIDLAPRAPATVGDAAFLRGEYEWNEQGGVIHWTHHDPQGRRIGGWIEVRGERYR